MMYKFRSNRSRQQGSVEGLLGGLANLIDKLGELAEKGEELKRSGQFDVQNEGKTFKGVYGFTVRTGIGGDRDEVKVEPFGNIKRDKSTGQAVVQEVREPVVDIFDEQDHVLLVVEMPGVSATEVKTELHDDILTMHAGQGERSYYKEIILPAHCDAAALSVTCNNGLVEIRCPKLVSGDRPRQTQE